jgi:tetratricopeptide (TPR) repeat protein
VLYLPLKGTAAMALVDPYSPCPCGSGEKYKWCCHKAEVAAIRVERLIVNEQFDQALRAVDDALTKEPSALWLLSQKEFLHDRKGEYAEARKAADQITKLKPDHEMGWLTKVRLAVLMEGVRAGIEELQRGLAANDYSKGPKLVKAITLVGKVLHENGDYVPALAHLALASEVSDDETDNEDALAAAQAFQRIQSDGNVSPWAKGAYLPSLPPDELTPEHRGRFEAALLDVERGLWSRAAARFETLAADGVTQAEKNLGLCRLWLGENVAGAAALRRYIARLGNSIEAVDLEALAQLDEPVGPEDLVERVRLSWPIKHRDALLELLGRLVEAGKAISQGEEALHPEDPKSPKALAFDLLSGAIPAAREGLKLSDLPKIESSVLVGPDAVYLETYDDARLNERRDQFIEIAGSTIPPAHPKLRVVERHPKHVLALRSDRMMSADLPRGEYSRLVAEQFEELLLDKWANTPMPYLRRRTPKQAAAAGDAEVPLRAALCLIEASRISAMTGAKVARELLKIPAEPSIEPDTETLINLNPGRLINVAAAQLDDEQLQMLRARALLSGVLPALENACRGWLDRPEKLNELPAAERFAIFSDLARCLLSREEPAEALAVIEAGRADEPPAHRAENAPGWDMLEVRLKARTEPPEQWVPFLATVLERYRTHPDAGALVLQSLIQLGLVRVTPNPEKPDQMLLDTRILSTFLERYGPRVVTADGALGVSAGKPEIWTPEKETGGTTGSIWTPGAPAESVGAKGEGSKLYIPGL